ncbi:MAG: hydantoinase/oxoprolinase family protein [Desulfobacterales bacterium]|jgi:N-methylhydantoinase A
MRIGIDVGGTFTDVVLLDEGTATFDCIKTPTTHHDLTEGVLDGLDKILNLAEVSIVDIDHIIHGTTIGTNAIVEGKGARVGLITTAGFEDVLEIRRVARPKEAAFDFNADNPPPLVPRFLRKGISERIDRDGQILVPLDETSVRTAIDYLKRQHVAAIAVSLLFSFLNPLHELKVADICREEVPDLPVSLSSEICPEFREYERTCTCVMNAYLGPVIRQYMDNLIDRLEKKYGEVRLHIMQSNGGTMSAAAARDRAAHLINSGPAAGAIAAAFVSRMTGDKMAVGADMGGTTFDISLIDENLPKTTTWGGVTNYPIKLPMVDLKTIGAGGGSIAWVDDGGVMNVGPQSSGSNPGPACYGWGGDLPTVSDANLVLGRLNPNYFLGGKLKLHPDRAFTAIKKKVADKMEISVEAAAAGIIRIVNANMAKGISGISVERGYDLRDFALVTMGGAAALHAVDIAGELNINKIVVPPMSGNFSAVGLVVADIQHDLVRTYAKKEPDIDPINLVKLYKGMEHDGIGQLISEGVVQKDIVISWSADLRYEGQSWELNTIIRPATSMTKSDLKQIVQDFNQLHQQVYAYSEPDEVVEFVNLRVRAVGKNPTLTLPGIKMPAGPIVVKADDTRSVYFETGGWQKIPIYQRENLAVGSELNGPCIIEEPISTTLIPVGFSGAIDEFENIIIEAERAYGI